MFAQHGNTSMGPTLADDVLNRVTINAANCDFDMYDDDIHQTMVDLGVLDAAQAFTGTYLINFCSAGMLSKAVPAAGLDMKLDVSNPSGANNDSLLISPRRLLSPVGFTGIQSGKPGKNNTTA